MSKVITKIFGDFLGVWMCCLEEFMNEFSIGGGLW